MKTSYTPSKLSAIASQIRKEHPSCSEVREYKTDQEFLDEIRHWASLPESEVDSEASIIPIRKIRALANYIPENFLHLPLTNLIQIVFLRADDEMIRLLYIQWQECFTNSDLCNLLYQIAQDKPQLMHKITSDEKIAPTTMMQWFHSGNIPYAVGKECMRFQKIQRIRFADRLMSLGIFSTSRLGQKCIQDYLTFCDRIGYLELKDTEMLSILKKSSPAFISSFLKNILSELKTEDFQQYYKCGSYIRDTYTGSNGSAKYKSYFSGFSPEQELKYRRWLNYILIKDTFIKAVDDARLKFWSQYVPYSTNVYKSAVSKSLVIEFEAYCVVEFFEDTKGALYIYQKEIFEEYIARYVMCFKNNDLRHELYANLRHLCSERISHHDGWQYKTSRYLTANKIV